MGKKYYCDYCDKAFADNPTNRKNHARGVHHRQAMKVHYDAFKDAETQLREDSSKRPCRSFNNTGSCQFGPSCHFSHITNGRRKQLENEVRAKQEAHKRKMNPTAASPDFDVDAWVAKRLKTNSMTTTNTSISESRSCDLSDRLQSRMEPNSMDTSDNVSDDAKGVFSKEYRIPDMFRTIPMLPPSLIPPNAQSLVGFEPVTWGPS